MCSCYFKAQSRARLESVGGELAWADTGVAPVLATPLAGSCLGSCLLGWDSGGGGILVSGTFLAADLATQSNPGNDQRRLAMEQNKKTGYLPE